MSDTVTAVDAKRQWRYALVGGLVSIPLVVGHYWLSGAGSYFSLNMVVVGGLLAGFLARRASLDVGAVGLRAGVVGSAPAVSWLFGQYLWAAEAFSMTQGSAGAALIVAVLVSSVVLLIGALAGLVGAVVGGWLASRYGT